MYIKVKVTPAAKKESVEKIKEQEFHIAVREKAERNMANTRVREVLAAYLGKSVAEVRLISGHHSRIKMFSVAE